MENTAAVRPRVGYCMTKQSREQHNRGRIRRDSLPRVTVPTPTYGHLWSLAALLEKTPGTTAEKHKARLRLAPADSHTLVAKLDMKNAVLLRYVLPPKSK